MDKIFIQEDFLQLKTKTEARPENIKDVFTTNLVWERKEDKLKKLEKENNLLKKMLEYFVNNLESEGE